MSAPRHATFGGARGRKRAAMLLSRLEIRERWALLRATGRRVAFLRPGVDQNVAGEGASPVDLRLFGRRQAAGVSALSGVRTVCRPARDRLLSAALQLFSEH